MQVVTNTMAHRRLPTAACIGAVVLLLVLASSAARAGNYPYCIKGDYYVSPAGDCSFDTYQQCLATASGRRAYCDVNPFYPPGKTIPPHILMPEGSFADKSHSSPIAERAVGYSTAEPRCKSASICNFEPPPKRAR